MGKTMDPELLALNLEAAAVHLEACVKNPKINFGLAVIERKYTVAEVMRQAVDHIRVT